LRFARRQSDPSLAEHQCLTYDINLSMGIQAGSRFAPDTASLLMMLNDAMSATLDLFMRRNFLGSITNKVECKCRQVFIGAVAETHLVLQGYLSNPPDDSVDLAETDAVVELDSLHSLDASDPCETEESDWLSDTSDSLEELMSMSACSDSSTVASLTEAKDAESDCLSDASESTVELILEFQDMDCLISPRQHLS